MRNTKKQLYPVLAALSNGKFSDVDWSSVDRMLDHLRSVSTDFTVSVRNGGYSPDGMSKTYGFGMTYNGKAITGHLTAFACGVVENPWSQYDVAICID